MRPINRTVTKVFAISSVLLVAGVLTPSSAAAQRPTPEQAEALLRSRPEVVEQLRARLLSSGLSASQIRARLQAEGYPSSLLDAYLPGGLVDSTTVPGDDVFAAVRALGIIDSLTADSLRVPRERRLTIAQIDSAIAHFADSAGIELELIEVRTDDLPPGIQALLRRKSDLLRAQRFARERVDSGFTLFGVDIFRRETTQFDANLSGPVDPNYRIGPGDRLVLILTGDVESAQTLDVSREGFVVIPQVGQEYVANLTLGQLEDLLFSRLRRVYSGVGRGPGATTRFSISVARLRSNQVYVVGDVQQPGSYRISSAGTVLTALYAAGGPTDNGSLRNVEVRRGGSTIGRLDVYDYLLRGDASGDIRLETGDVVFIHPRGGRVRVWGEVIRPATYELREGETLADILRAAGGLTATADRRRVQIERILPPEQRGTAGSDRVLMDLASNEPGASGVPAIPMQPGDVVRVFEVAERLSRRIAVTGNVWAPGPVGFTPGMMLSDALRLAGGLRPDSYLGQVLVTRLRPDSTREQLRAALLDTTGRAIDDIVLSDADEIHVYSQTEFRPRRYVVVSGAVRRSGRYPYREGMTMRDLVLLAGGLQEGALLNEAEIARLSENRAAGEIARTVRVPLDSGYLFERSPDGRYLGPPGLPAPAVSGREIQLQPYDHVLILRQPDWSLQKTVHIGGEVKYPGRYALREKRERLADVIERAGGLTTEAYPGGVIFIREDKELGRIGLDLPAVLRNSRHRDNMVLADGDSIFIPVFSNVVTVRGAVNSPVAVAYVPGRDIDYYINAAGGPTRRADHRRAFVTQPGGKVESRRSRALVVDYKPLPKPGSSVFVPELPESERRDATQILAVTAQILGSLVAIVAVARSF
jgi:polysaccharide biosynthesis/export protein